MNISSEHELNDVLRSVFESHRDRPSIHPSWLATEAMVEMEFPRELHQLGYLGCHLALRQLARALCRKVFDPKETLENDLFPDTLQDRYPRRPAKDTEEPEYVLLSIISKEDAMYNVDRLRKESMSKLRHADALEAWIKKRFAA